MGGVVCGEVGRDDHWEHEEIKSWRRDGIVGTMSCNHEDTKRQSGLGMEMEAIDTL